MEICTGYSTDPFEYTFSVDGIRYTDMIKKGKQNLYPGSIQSNDTSTYSNDTSAARRSSTAAVNGYSNGDARRSSVTKPFASTASNDDNNTNNNSLPSKPTPTAAVDRGNFQSPPLAANADAGSFDFFGTEDSSDPFAEPSSMPATKPSSVVQKLFAEPAQPRQASATATPSFDPFVSTPKQATPSFDPFAESPKQASSVTFTPSFDPFASNSHSSVGVDPFAPTSSGSNQQSKKQQQQQQFQQQAPTVSSSSDPFSNPAATASASTAMTTSPNFMDDFSPGPVSTAPNSHQQKPSRRASANDISLGFAGMSFAAAPPQPPVTAAAAAEPNPFEDDGRVDDVVSKPAPAVVSDPWADSKLVNLDLSGKTVTAASSTNHASTVKGPSLSSMMTSGAPLTGSNGTLIPSKPMSTSSSSSSMGSQSAMNARASFIGQPDVSFQPSIGTRSSFIAPMQGGMGMGSPMQGGMGMGAPLQSGMGMGAPIQGGMGMGAPMQGGMGMGAPMQGGMGMGASMQGGMGMGAPMQGGMGMGPRSSFIASSNNQQMSTRGSLIPTPTAASKSNAGPQSSLDSLNPFA